MDFQSILNDVLGPVMRGPSSSHTAGSYRIGRMARSLLGAEPAFASFSFDPLGSYARTFREQGADRAFTAGLLSWDIGDARFLRALEHAEHGGLTIEFHRERLEGADHPNFVRLSLRSQDGLELRAAAKSTGGGGFLFSEIDGCPAVLDGKSFALLILAEPEAASAIAEEWGGRCVGCELRRSEGREGVLLIFESPFPFNSTAVEGLKSRPGVRAVRTAEPVFFIKRGEALFSNGAELAATAVQNHWSLGQAALAYETRLLGMTEDEVRNEIASRYAIMKGAVEMGLEDDNVHMQLLDPSARSILEAERQGRLAVGGAHARAAARAMAVLHISSSGGVVCAAPTGASSGVIPGVVMTLAEDRALADGQIVMALLAAGAVGLIVSLRATFAAETAGCQVEIGAAGAMAAAAVVEAGGGSALQALDAAAISFQNTMGSVCDLVKGICEIPCHTRNAASAAAAFVAADLILGGYVNPIPFDETVDAVFLSGKMLPGELRCTARGGIALTPSALALPLKKAEAEGSS